MFVGLLIPVSLNIHGCTVVNTRFLYFALEHILYSLGRTASQQRWFKSVPTIFVLGKNKKTIKILQLKNK